MSTVTTGEVLTTLPDDQAKKIRRLLERGVAIPPQPRVLDELQRQIRAKVADVRVLARVIQQDPGITALLFKVVTSPAYRQHQPFESVEHILQAVGIQQTANLVRAIALAQLGDVKKNPRAYEAFWARSHAVAQLAMLIADERITVCNIFPDQAYAAGIFHDCGVLLLMQRFAIYCAEMKLDEPGRWVDLRAEDAKFSADHCVVGYLVAKHWHLPEFIADAIRFHHDILNMGTHVSRTMVGILQLAIEIYYRDQRVENPEWDLVKDEVLGELGLDEAALPEFVDVITERFHGDSH